ncbi:PREDICTED: acylphosphatase-1-like isoform X3 [Vollenhovia emeryi]|uniref:acylphosphatase-1-like isoform X3 n=1 Tax=Vollenhovia emeryi TaxID=411798 RepID=UPI0005F38788|nr:PREDICTED: acylphosphatase-1-like isoform X3 [Vollenhovia emeryi]
MIGFILLVCLSFPVNPELPSLAGDETEMARMLALDFEVFGVVQGVFFRKVSERHLASVWRLTMPTCYNLYTQKRGKELGLKGWCMNTPNGTVVGHLEGEKGQIEEMKEWLRRTGSPQSRIDKAEFRNEKEISQLSFSNFEIRK